MPTKPRTPAKKKPAPKSAAKKTPSARQPPKKYAQRADFGKPVDGFFAKHPPALRAILVELRALVEAAVPDATASIKWGMPFYSRGQGMVCALGAHKAHVNLILSGPAGLFADPRGVLTGAGKTGRHLTLRPGDTIPKAEIRAWLKAAAANAG